MAGFLILADQAIPIIRLHRLLNLPEPELGLYTHIVLLRENGGGAVGWIVDRVTQIISVQEDEIMPIPANHTFANCAKGMLRFKETDICVVSAGQVLLEKERECVLEFQRTEQGRLRELAPATV